MTAEAAFILEAMVRLLDGVPLTLSLAGLSIAAGGTLAVLLTILRRASPVLGMLVSGYVFVLRGTPLLVQLFLIYYGVSQFPAVRHSALWPFLRQPYWCAILAFTLNTAAYGYEILRGGLQAVPRGTVEAGQALGLSRLQVYWKIILPLAVRLALPAYGNEIIIMVKSTALASIVTLMDVTGIAAELIADTFRAFEIFGCAGAIYLMINAALTFSLHRLERWLAIPGQAVTQGGAKAAKAVQVAVPAMRPG